MSQQTSTSKASEFAILGARLVRFGQALQSPDTTVAQLTSLANSCGIQLKLRAVAESEGVMRESA